MIQYAIIPLQTRYSVPPSKLEASRDICGHRMEGLGCSDLLTTFKTTKRFPDFSKIYRRSPPIIRFVHDPRTLVGVDEGSRWYRKWRSMISASKK